MTQEELKQSNLKNPHRRKYWKSFKSTKSYG